jgi:hypothetical protein
MGNVNALISAQSDPRKAEVYGKLRDELISMTASSEQEAKDLKNALELIVASNEARAAALGTGQATPGCDSTLMTDALRAADALQAGADAGQEGA